MGKKIVKICDVIVGYISALLLFFFFIMIIGNVLCREVFKVSIIFFDELSTYSFIWMVFLSGALAFMEDTHFKVDILPTRVQKKYAVPLHYLEMLAIAVFAVIMLYFGIIFARYNARITTLVLKLPVKLLVLCIPLSAVLTMVAIVMREITFRSQLKEERGAQTAIPDGPETGLKEEEEA